MKKEIMQEWVKALRSGKYKQGVRKLRTYDGKYCCLGVLCEISGVGRWCDFDSLSNYTVNKIGYSVYPPPEVREYAGMGNTGYRVVIDGDLGSQRFTSLPDLNDNGHSFEQIADIIEQQYEML